MADLIYANARASALYKTLIGAERLNRMADSADADTALKVLSEVNYGGGATLDASEFEKLIDFETQKFFSFLKSYGVPKAVAKFFMLKNDYHNAEAFIKSKYLKTDPQETTTVDGLIEKATLKEKIYADEYDALSSEMRSACIACDGEFTSGKATGASVNAAFTKAYYQELYSVAKTDKRLKEVFIHKVDCINIGVALRARNYASVKEWFIDGGALDGEQLKKLCEEPLENIKEKFTLTDYKEEVAAAVDAKLKGEPLWEFERAADGFMLRRLKRERYETEGNLPLLLYCTAFVSETANVRIIVSSLLGGKDKTQIKNKLRELYER